jgi:hypothetical protein
MSYDVLIIISSSRQQLKYKIGIQDFPGTFSNKKNIVAKRSLMINEKSLGTSNHRMTSNIHFLLTSALSPL